LKHYHDKGDALLSYTVTEDETWMHHYVPESKCQSMEWKPLTSPVKKEVQNTTMNRKSDFDTFLGCTRANFGTLPKNRGTTVNSDCYASGPV
jgi:hypothetical protein